MIPLNYFILNGQKYCTKSKLTILDALIYFNYNTQLLVLEYNNTIYQKSSWSKTFLKNNDKIEIITIVGGG